MAFEEDAIQQTLGFICVSGDSDAQYPQTFEKLHLEVPFQNPREPLLPPSSLTLEKPHWDAKGRLLIGCKARMSSIKIQSCQSRDDEGESFPEEGFDRWQREELESSNDSGGRQGWGKGGCDQMIQR